MLETNTATPGTEEKRVPASLGAPQRIVVVLPQDNGENEGNQNNSAATGGEGTGQSEADKATATLALAEAEKNKIPEISDEVMAKYLESKGITGFKTAEELKAKLETPAAVAAPPTPEEIAKTAADLDKRMLDLFLEGGGNIDNYAVIKQVANMDLKELSEKELVRELTSKGFNDAEIAALKQERYYQINLDELEQDLINGETDEEFESRKVGLKKKQEFYTEKLSTRSKHTQEQAKGILKNLYSAIEKSESSKKASEESERKLSAKTDEILSKIPKKVTYELGKTLDNSADIVPVQHEVDDADIAEVGKLLKDPTLRNNFLYTPEGDLNLQAIADIKVENATLKKALKNVYLEAEKRTVERFSKVFPHVTPQSLGVGTNGREQTNGGGKKTAASIGKSQRVAQGQS